MTATAHRTRTAQVVEILTKEILTGQYRAGERLPSERELAARFETSRGAIREALKTLERVGIAKVQPGGTRVAPIGEATLDVIGDLLEAQGQPGPELVADMIETLQALAVLAVRTTVQRAGDAELDALRAEIALLRASIEDVETFMESFSTLTHRFMRTSGNLVLRLISNSLHMQLANRRRPIPERLEVDTDRLSELDEALRARSPANAAGAISHLVESIGRQLVEAAKRERSRAAGG